MNIFKGGVSVFLLKQGKTWIPDIIKFLYGADVNVAVMKILF